MTFWTLTFFALFLGILELKPVWEKLHAFFYQSKRVLQLRKAISHLKLLQEILESGLAPEKTDWQKIEAFPDPWGKSLFRSVQELRADGAPVLPSLHRMQKTLEEQTELILEGNVKCSQALGQAVVGVCLIPLFALFLWWMLPELQQAMRDFFLIAIFSLFLCSISFIWMLSMADEARYGNLSSKRRLWLVSVNVALERLLALISTGQPPDLAWQTTVQELAIDDPILAREWNGQVWSDDGAKIEPKNEPKNETEKLILHLGTEIRRSIQTSLIEGRASLDRIESLHRAYLLDLRMKISRELNLLPNRCLKPLFILVLPSVMVLLVGALFLTMREYG